jgi:L-fuconolactonase
MRTLPPVGKIKHGCDEPIVDPGIPIIDAHHHLFDRPHLRYMLENYLEEARLGHNVVATVYMETLSMARPDGPEVLRPLGEVEFANGVAAICASGRYGPCRVGAAIVGSADLTFGDGVAVLLDRCCAAAPDRYRGIRQGAMSHPDPTVMRYMTNPPPPDLLDHPNFRAGFRHLAPRNLSFDASLFHFQIPDLIALAADHPDTVIVLNHAGMAFAMDMPEHERTEAYRGWRENIGRIARLPNVYCKIGGLGMAYWGFGLIERAEPIGSQELAAIWRPCVEAVVEAFGAERCMMESNYPNDGRACGFVPLWNALKLSVQGCSVDEKAALFHGTAAKVYRIGQTSLS